MARVLLAAYAATSDLSDEQRNHVRGLVDLPRRAHLRWVVRIHRCIPAFTVALLGFVLFVGVLTERSRSVWPSGLAHGSWNALVQSYFSSSGAEQDRVFTGSRYLLGEFGWLGAASMLILGVGLMWWHFRPTKGAWLRRSRPVTSHR